ncbi:hypothetical protein CAPTEDRAFT_104682, partial [Capitella teleta]
EEVKSAITSLEAGKSATIDNIPGEFLKSGEEQVVGVFLKLCQKIWDEEKGPSEWTQSLVIPRPKKRNLSMCNN